MTWRKFGVLVRHLPRDSALVQLRLGQDAEWDLANMLRAAGVNALRGANWQRANAGAKNPSPQPDPIGPPSMTRRKSRGDAMPIPELRAEIERRQRAPAVRKG